jgi:hypothetical protein
VAVKATTRRQARREWIEAQLKQKNEHYPEPTTDELLAQSRALLAKIDERLGITYQPAGDQGQPPETDGPQSDPGCN